MNTELQLILVAVIVGITILAIIRRLFFVFGKRSGKNRRNSCHGCSCCPMHRSDP